MRTDNKNSEKDLNANRESRLNTNRPVTRPADTFPESRQAHGEMEKVERTERIEDDNREKDDNIELLAQDVNGTVSARDTSSSPEDIAGVPDLDGGMRRGSRRNR